MLVLCFPLEARLRLYVVLGARVCVHVVPCEF